MGKKILIIEDHVEISESIRKYLELDDFEVTCIDNGEQGLNQALSGKYDLILQDIMLPEIDGFTIARKVKEKLQTPVIMITAKDAIADKLKGFELGALDYIVKPFDLRELEVRINLALNKNQKKQKIIIGNVEIDIDSRRFTKDWLDVSLTQKEFLIMEILIHNEWKPVSRTDILEYAWGWGDSIFDGDAKLDVYVSTIRNKLNKEVLKTIKGFWYQIPME